jgi:single-stranded-DNA-specific exonuclease
MNQRAATRSDEATLFSLPPIGETASGLPWRLAGFDSREALAIAQRAGIEPALARVLAARGVAADEAEEFLAPTLKRAMPDPFVLKDMDRAAARLARAVRDGETIGVFGDYDVDGVTAAAMLTLYFREVGVRTIAHLPDRIAEGYGPNIAAFRALARDGARVIVTVDCGAAAHDVVEAAAREGLSVVVLDHHLMAGAPPEGAAAVVNPNRLDDVSGLTGLSAAGVAFMALVALNRALREAVCFAGRTEPDLRRLLDLAALGLVCDVMPMTGLTRVLVAQGLKVLGARTNPGLEALARKAGAKGAPSAYQLGFLLGPRINAAGRIGHARLALELLTSEDAARREELADRLNRLNAERQAIEAATLDAAAAQARRSQSAVLVVSGEGWHPGVVGIVAGRLKDMFERPSFALAIDGEVARGSGRSIAGVDLGSTVAEARARGLIDAGGGHAMAAGVTLRRESIGAFHHFLENELEGAINRALAGRGMIVDAVLPAMSATGSFARLIETAGPFGPGNPEPVFAICDLRAEKLKVVGERHLAMTLGSETGEAVRAIAFRAEGAPLGALLRARARVHVLGKLRIDDWRGEGAAQLHVIDAAAAA